VNSDQAVARVLHGSREEIPEQETGQDKNCIGMARIGLDLRQPIEQERKDEHRKQGLTQNPKCPQNSLAISNLQISPDENVEQLAEAPKIPMLMGRQPR